MIRSSLLIAALAFTLIPSSLRAKDTPERVLRAGAATSNITPFLGMEIVGNFAPRPIAATVHDELHARCLVLDDGTTKLAFVVVDSLHLQRDIWDEAREKIEAATGIPGSNQMLSATHTHSSTSAVMSPDKSIDYRALLVARIVDGVTRAHANLEPARIAWGAGQLPQWVHSRRWRLKEGVTNPNPFGGEDLAVMNPPASLREQLAGPAGPTNPEVFCLSVQAADGRQIALMANYWLHYVGGVPREDLSADYFGEFSRLVAERLTTSSEHPPVVGMLANGPCGDVNSNDYSGKTPRPAYQPYEKIRLVAGQLADEVLRVHKKMKYQEWVSLQAAFEELELEPRRPSAEIVKWSEEVLAKPADEKPKHPLERNYAIRAKKLHETRDEMPTQYPMQVFRVGGLGIAAIPFEVFTQTGLDIKARSPFKDTFTIELANGGYGYLPTPDQHDLGGYETWLGTNRVEREASVKITNKILEMFDKVAEKKEKTAEKK